MPMPCIHCQSLPSFCLFAYCRHKITVQCIAAPYHHSSLYNASHPHITTAHALYNASHPHITTAHALYNASHPHITTAHCTMHRTPISPQLTVQCIAPPYHHSSLYNASHPHITTAHCTMHRTPISPQLTVQCIVPPYHHSSLYNASQPLTIILFVTVVQV